VDVSPLLSGKEDDKRDIDVLLMGNRVGRLPGMRDWWLQGR
jgi:hypothetical protein